MKQLLCEVAGHKEHIMVLQPRVRPLNLFLTKPSDSIIQIVCKQSLAT